MSKTTGGWASWALLWRRAMIVVLAATLAGCLEESGGEEDAETPPPSAPATPDPVNHPPEISGTPPASVEAGQMYSFTPTASDADNDFLEFSGEGVPAWAQLNAETGALTGSPGDEHVGETGDITITVTDGRDSRSIGPFRIVVRPRSAPPPPANTPPTISGSPAPSVMAGQAYSFQPTASDADGDRLRFSISNRPSWASFSTSTGRLAGTPTLANVGTFSNIVISVSDGAATTSLPPFAIQVLGPDNRAPTISGTPATSVQVGQSYSFRPSASDPDGDSLTFSISNKPSWASFSSSTGRLSGSPTASHVGTYANIVIRVSDGRASASLPAFTINVTAAPNNAPTISGSPPRSVTAGSQYSFTPTASDADKDTLGFSIENRPVWATFDTATGRLSGTPTDAHVGTHAGIVISVSDGKASASLPAFSITVNAPSNDPPTISGNPPKTAKVGEAYSFRPTASDPDGDTLKFSIQNRPAWADFNESTGQLSGTPQASHVGSYPNIVITVSDGEATASLAAFTITVEQPTTDGTATLSWTPPTQNTDGSQLTDLAGFRIVYGTSASALNQLIEVPNASVSTYVVTDLSSGTWYFAVKAYNKSGVESALSNVASKTIP